MPLPRLTTFQGLANDFPVELRSTMNQILEKVELEFSHLYANSPFLEDGAQIKYVKSGSDVKEYTSIDGGSTWTLQRTL